MTLDDGKVPLKSVHNTLNRFKTSLPQLCTQLRQHVDIIKSAKRQANIRALNKEQIAASRTFKNLNHYLRELDELEHRVFYSDLEKFKAVADPLRQSAYNEIVKFVELDNNLDKVQESDLVSSQQNGTSQPGPSNETHDDLDLHHTIPLTDEEPHAELMSLQASQSSEPHAELMSLQASQSSGDDLRQLEATAKSWNQLQLDIQDVAEIMANLAKMVKTQGEELDTIEQNVEVAKLQTTLGLLEIIKARRAKFASVPVAGAVVGCMVGGPLGMLVGFKVAGVVTAALGTYVGYKSGKYLTNKINEDLPEGTVPGRLEAPTLGAYEDEDQYMTGLLESPTLVADEDEDQYLTDDSVGFQEFGSLELRLSEEYKPYKT